MRADDPARHRASTQIVARDHVEQLVAVVQAAIGIDHHQAVTVAVERKAEIGAVLLDRRLQVLGMHGADAGVDVETVGIVADGDHLGAELVKHRRRDVIGGAVCAVDHQLHALQIELVGKSRLAKFDVATRGIVDTKRLAELG